MQSENAEMYLVSLALLEETGTPTPIPLPRLAEELNIQIVSANQMVRKLEEEGLVSYQPYKGVSFTEPGYQLAQMILRHRRLWEVFFVESLGFSPDEADTLACRMEHITGLNVADRLSDYLNNPETSPTGKAIPTAQTIYKPPQGIPLSQLQPGQSGLVKALNVDDTASAYLISENLIPGTLFKVQAVSRSGTYLLDINTHTLSLAKELAARIMVNISEDPQHNAV